MATCPFCLVENIHEQARRCPHCGSWLDEREDYSRQFDELRKEIRAELKEDLKTHREYLNSLFNRVQLAATIIIVLVLGVFTYLGLRTDKGVHEITERMKGQIEARLASKESQTR